MEDIYPYFYYSFQEFIFWSIPIALLFYLLNYTCRKILHKINSNRITQLLYDSFKIRSKLWVLMVMLLDPGLFKLTYEAFIQISLPFFFDFRTKANMIFCISVLFVVILYSLTFNLMIRRFYPKSSEIILTAAKSTRRGFVLETLTISTNKAIKAFIHSSIIQYHSNKMILLIIF